MFSAPEGPAASYKNAARAVEIYPSLSESDVNYLKLR